MKLELELFLLLSICADILQGSLLHLVQLTEVARHFTERGFLIVELSVFQHFFALSVVRLLTFEKVLVNLLDRGPTHRQLLALVLILLSSRVGVLEIVITVHQIVTKRLQLLALVDNVALALRAQLCILELLIELASDDCVSFLLLLPLLSILSLFQELFHPQKLTLLLEISLDIFRLFADFPLSVSDVSLLLFPDFLFEFLLDLFFPREHLLLALDLVGQVLHVNVGNHLLVALVWLDDESLRILRWLGFLVMNCGLRLSNRCGFSV